MTTTSYYDYSYSPPVSPKSLPKRKASTQDDDLENNSLISRSFKKLRLNASNAKRPPANRAPSDASTNGIVYADPSTTEQLDSAPWQPHAQSRSHAHLRHQTSGSDEDFMPVDDTSDRVWVADLDAEIAAIEAEEEKQRAGLQLLVAGNEYSKIPEHLLKPNTKPEDPAASMQMVLYRDPVSISVPEEEDAVRKTIIEARRRMRERQAIGPQPAQSPPSFIPTPDRAQSHDHDSISYADDEMDMDLD